MVFSNHGLSFFIYTSPTLVNNVIYGNTSTDSGGDLRIHGYDNTVRVRNTIFWNDSASNGNAEIHTSSFSDSLAVDYSDVEGGAPVTGIGNINLNPEFIDSTNYNFHLSQTSRCIDASNSTNVPSTDADENLTNQDSNNDTSNEHDMGAFEFLQDIQSTISSRFFTDYIVNTLESGTSNTIASITLNGTISGSGEITVNCFIKSRPLYSGVKQKTIRRWYRIIESGDSSYINADLRLFEKKQCFGLGPGLIKLNWNAKNLTSGIYHYQIYFINGDHRIFTKNGKMTLIK